MERTGVTTMRRLHPDGGPAPRPVSWSAVPADDPAAHEQMIKFISESIVCDIQGNMSCGFMKQVDACKKSPMSPHDKAERMRLVRDMRTTLERLTEELGQKFFEEFRYRPPVGRWYDSWLFNETPQFLRWEQEWAFAPNKSLDMAETRSVASSAEERVFGSETTPEVRVDPEDDLDEDVDEFEDSREFPQIPGYRPDAPVTEKTTEPMTSAKGCRCEHGEDSGIHLCKNCACSSQGYGCLASCGCDETCKNNFNNVALDKVVLDNIIGTDLSAPPAKLHPCFISYLQNHKLEEEEITLDYLFEHLLSGLDYVPDGNDEAIDAWRVKWGTTCSGPDPIAITEGLERELLRIGLGFGGDSGRWFFSFCYPGSGRIGSWQQGHQIWHCRDCGRCAEGQDWHCSSCNKCTYGKDVPCGGCGGVSRSYHDQNVV